MNTSDSRKPMIFAAQFLAVAIVMLVAWRGSRKTALAVFAVVLITSVTIYLDHATDVLKLSF
jgi:hypothetical protein